VDFSEKLTGGLDRVVCQQERLSFRLSLAVTMGRGGGLPLDIEPVEEL